MHSVQGPLSHGHHGAPTTSVQFQDVSIPPEEPLPHKQSLPGHHPAPQSSAVLASFCLRGPACSRLFVEPVAFSVWLLSLSVWKSLVSAHVIVCQSSSLHTAEWRSLGGWTAFGLFVHQRVGIWSFPPVATMTGEAMNVASCVDTCPILSGMRCGVRSQSPRDHSP